MRGRALRSALALALALSVALVASPGRADAPGESLRPEPRLVASGDPQRDTAQSGATAAEAGPAARAPVGIARMPASDTRPVPRDLTGVLMRPAAPGSSLDTLAMTVPGAVPGGEQVPNPAPAPPISRAGTAPNPPQAPEPRPGEPSVEPPGPPAAAVHTVRVQIPPERAGLRPPRRPGTLAPETGAAMPPSAPVPVALRPPQRPVGLGARAPAVQPAPSAQPAALPPARSHARGTVCGSRTIRGQAIPPVPGRIRGCGIDAPVRVTEVAGVRLSTPATIDCPTALALHDWVERGAKPAIGRTGGGLAGLQVAAHYACRTRNNRPGARISEHGRGRAVDISAFILANGQRITVLHGWRSRNNGPALRRMHAAACGPFGTVLGPNADRFHQNHFHFDTARYRSGPYCR